MQTQWQTQVCTEMRSKTVRHVNHVSACRFNRALLARSGPRKTRADSPMPAVQDCVRWVVCHETVCCPVTVCKKVKVCVPCTKQVCTYQCVNRTVQVPVCRTRCVPECRTEKYTVCTTRCVPVQCTRQVCVNVPHQVTEPSAGWCRSAWNGKFRSLRRAARPAAMAAITPVATRAAFRPATRAALAKGQRLGGCFSGFSRLCGKRNSGCCDGGFIAAAPTGCCH